MYSIYRYLHASGVITRPPARGVIAERRNIVTISSLTALERYPVSSRDRAQRRRIYGTWSDLRLAEQKTLYHARALFLSMNYSRVRSWSVLELSSEASRFGHEWVNRTEDNVGFKYYHPSYLGHHGVDDDAVLVPW